MDTPVSVPRPASARPALTETPLPLKNAKGVIVYPGFPADVLFNFRLYSIAAQLVLWGAIGLIFAPLADRLLATPAKVRLSVMGESRLRAVTHLDVSRKQIDAAVEAMAAVTA